MSSPLGFPIQPSSLTPFLVFGLAFLVLSHALTTRTRPLPLGPRLGWFASEKLPKAYQWLTYAKWRYIYGRELVFRASLRPDPPLLR